MNQRKKYSLTPSILDEGFFPSLLRQFSLFDDESWTPLSTERSNLSLSEDENNVYVEAHLPGIPEENIELTEDKGILWIKGEAKEKEEDPDRKYYHRATKSFSYRVAIPGNIDESKEPKAVYDKGVIKVTFSKLKKEAPKKIKLSQ